jgi:hypothetical protein
VVAHRDPHLAVALLDRELHLAVRRRELDRVGQQVGHHLRQPVRIGVHLAGHRRRVESDPYAVVVREAAIGLDRLLHDRVRLDAPESEGDLVGLHLLDVQNIVDQPDQPLAVRLRDREQPGGGVG